MRMKILDYALLTLFSGATPLVLAQAVPDAAPAKAADCGATGCKSDEGLLFKLETRGERDPATMGLDDHAGDERLRPDRRVTIEAHGVDGVKTSVPQPGKATASGKFALQLPNGGIVWATEDPTLGVAELSVSGPSVVAFENGRITKPVPFYLRSNYPGFIQRIELTVYRASDSDLTEPLASFPMPVAGVSRAEWNGEMKSRYALRAGDDLIYIVRAYGKDGAFDETLPRSISLVRTEDAERGASLIRDSVQKSLGTPLTTQQAEAQSLISNVFSGNGLRQQNIAIYGSRIRIQGRNLPKDHALEINGESYPVDLERKFVAEFLEPIGSHAYKLVLKDGSKAVLSHTMNVEVTGNYYFGVAMADITIFQNKATGPGQGLALNGRTDTITETANTAGYSTAVRCVDANSANTGNTTGIASQTATVTIPAANMKDNAAYRCLFTNTRFPTVQIAKRSVGGVGGSAFTTTNLAAPNDTITTLADGVAVTAPAHVGTIGAEVTITETGGTAGYSTGVVCTDGSSAMTGNTVAIASTNTVVTIPAANMKAGATYSCLYTNTKLLAALDAVKTLAAINGAPPLPGAVLKAGDVVDYRIVVTNAGTAPGSTLIGETVPANMVYLASGATPSAWSCSDGAVAGAACSQASGAVQPGGATTAVTLNFRTQMTAQLAASASTAVNTVTSDSGSCSSCTVTTPLFNPPDPDKVLVAKALTAESGSQPGVAEAGETLTYTITLANTGGSTFNNYRFNENLPAGASLVGVSGASGATGYAGPVHGPGTVPLVVASVPANGVARVTVVFKVDDRPPAGMTMLANKIDGGDIPTGCVQACTVAMRIESPKIALTKTAAVREARVGDLVRYTLTLTNGGPIDLVAGRVLDTPPAGFSLVAGSAAVVDGDGVFTLGGGASPMVFGGIDLAAGQQATVSYLLRVGAGVRRGVHQNLAGVSDNTGKPISNNASADIGIVADGLTDESLIVGTVFDDRDGDGWQDPAVLSDVRVRGGFAPGAYIANSTTVDFGQGARPVPDASAPLLHGMAFGAIEARRSEAEPGVLSVVVRQRLSQASFTDDFVLTSAQGMTLRMDAAGRTWVEKTGDAAKGLSGAEPSVERSTTPVAGGYQVDYTVRNVGIAERGLPGVRIVSVEGLVVETDQHGRYSLTGVRSGDWRHGRNFILKVDPASLPAGAAFTTPNPLLRRVTPGMPARLDFGIRLPRSAP